MLQKIANDVHIDVWFGRHFEARDLGVPGGFEKALKKADHYFPEAIGWDDDDIANWDELSLLNRHLGEKEAEAWRRKLRFKDNTAGFTNREVAAVAQADVYVDLVDYCEDDLENCIPELRPSDDLRTAYKEDKNARDGSLESFLILAIFLYYREWIMVARLGHALNECIKKPRKADGKYHVVMTIGALHQDMLRKFAMLGVEATAVFPKTTDSTIEAIRSQTVIMAKYRYTADDYDLSRALDDVTKRW